MEPTTPGGPLARWLTHPGASEAGFLLHLARLLAAVAHGWWPVAAVVAGLVAVAMATAEATAARQARRGRWVAIAPPGEPDPAGGLALWRTLAVLLTDRRSVVGRRPPVAFEGYATADGLALGLWVSPSISAGGVAHAVETAWPGARATFDRPPRLPTGGRVIGARERLAAPDWFSLCDFPGSPGALDPLGGVLRALGGCGDDEAAVVQVLVRPARRRQLVRVRRAVRAIRRNQPTTATARLLDLGRHPPAGGVSATTDPLALADVREATAKVTAAPHFEAAVRVAVCSTATGGALRAARRRRRARLRQVVAAFGLYTGRNHLVGRPLYAASRTLARRRLRRGFLASVEEVAALAHLPVTPAGLGLPVAPARTVVPPTEVTRG